MSPNKPPIRHVRVVCISDTHELHREIDLPRGDMLIHAGDFTMFSKRPSMIADFDDWLGEQPFRARIVIPGNHEFALEKQRRPKLRNATLLINDGVEALGLKVWGAPLAPLDGGAYGCSNPEDRRRLYSLIPFDTDILVTHCPPYGILDGEPHAGCPLLREVVEAVRPKLHLFGHIHPGYGVMRSNGTIFANAAMLTEFGDVDRRPLVFDIPVGEGNCAGVL